MSSDLQYFPQICKELKKITKMQSEYPISRLRWAQDQQDTKKECYTLHCNIQSPMFLAIALDINCHVYIPATLPTMIVQWIYLSHRSSGYRLVTHRGPCTYCWEYKFKWLSECTMQSFTHFLLSDLQQFLKMKTFSLPSVTGKSSSSNRAFSLHI